MKNNKKGFTLAELLIVVAIIAILIGIAIPVFSGQLDNAKLQTDHANMRSAYSLAQVGTLQGGLYIGQSTDMTDIEACAAGYYFEADGSIDTEASQAYVLKATGSADKCKESAVCNGGNGNEQTTIHAAGNYIKVVKNGAEDGFEVKCDSTALS